MSEQDGSELGERQKMDVFCFRRQKGGSESVLVTLGFQPGFEDRDER